MINTYIPKACPQRIVSSTYRKSEWSNCVSVMPCVCDSATQKKIVISHLEIKGIPTSDKMIKTHAPNSTALRLPILVTAIVCTFSVRVVELVPVPQRPAKTPERPSRPIPLLTMPGVGGLDATNKDDA